ncbi:MAG: hypothetical protein P8Y95_11155 [Gammaproteobacteria bacterium]|jgi:hypothetical protein
MRKHWLAAMLAFATCAATSAETDPGFVDMQKDLAALKAEFNEAVDRVRLVFIVGPT